MDDFTTGAFVDASQPAATQSLEWTDERIRDFWDFWSQHESTQDNYFSKQVGQGITNLLQQVSPLKGKAVLDFGAGPGFLVQHLLATEAIVSATEHSPESVNVLNQRFANDKNWQGCSIVGEQEVSLPDASFDVITCLETIEHLSDRSLEFVMSEIHRLLKPGGFVMFTTPNDESLQQQTVFCPNCAHDFHRWQHMRSWNSESLTQSLQHYGYSVSFCDAFDVQAFQPRSNRRWDEITVRELRYNWGLAWRQLKDRLSPRLFPNVRSFKYQVGHGHPNNLVAIAGRP